MLEIKCPTRRKINSTGEVKGVICPIHYWDQVQIQLACCDLDECDFWQCDIKEYPTKELFEDAQVMLKKILKDKSKGDLSFAARKDLEKKMEKKKGAIKKIAKKILPQVKKADRAKLKKKDKGEK